MALSPGASSKSISPNPQAAAGATMSSTNTAKPIEDPYAKLKAYQTMAPGAARDAAQKQYMDAWNKYGAAGPPAGASAPMQQAPTMVQQPAAPQPAAPQPAGSSVQPSTLAGQPAVMPTQPPVAPTTTGPMQWEPGQSGARPGHDYTGQPIQPPAPGSGRGDAMPQVTQPINDAVLNQTYRLQTGKTGNLGEADRAEYEKWILTTYPGSQQAIDIRMRGDVGASQGFMPMAQLTNHLMQNGTPDAQGRIAGFQNAEEVQAYAMKNFGRQVDLDELAQMFPTAQPVVERPLWEQQFETLQTSPITPGTDLAAFVQAAGRRPRDLADYNLWATQNGRPPIGPSGPPQTPPPTMPPPIATPPMIEDGAIRANPGFPNMGGGGDGAIRANPGFPRMDGREPWMDAIPRRPDLGAPGGPMPNPAEPFGPPPPMPPDWQKFMASRGMPADQAEQMWRTNWTSDQRKHAGGPGAPVTMDFTTMDQYRQWKGQNGTDYPTIGRASPLEPGAFKIPAAGAPLPPNRAEDLRKRYRDTLVDPIKLIPQNWDNMTDDEMDFVLSAYEDSGRSARQVQNVVDRGRPGTAAARGYGSVGR